MDFDLSVSPHRKMQQAEETPERKDSEIRTMQMDCHLGKAFSRPSIQSVECCVMCQAPFWELGVCQRTKQKAHLPGFPAKLIL